jgi:undecaprenyl phosphate N,N'-diacetylbacillosamine 1-phosphate transferase
MYRKYFKRIFDFLMALILLILFSPVLFIVSIILVFYNNGKILFYQKRPGLNGKKFILMKFKTMKDEYLPNEMHSPERITSLGRFLRTSNIDELPQLINVLKGEMSLIGPRPLLTEYMKLYTERERMRHKVKPGLTGLAQISGGNLLPWKERLMLDVDYAERISFTLDLKILFISLYKFFTGGFQTGSIFPEKFNGTKDAG